MPDSQIKLVFADMMLDVEDRQHAREANTSRNTMERTRRRYGITSEADIEAAAAVAADNTSGGLTVGDP